jgi:YYY domain-containing protein
VIGQFLAVYLVIQIVTVATLPLALRFFAALPDRGYALARLLGILLTGYIFWIGYSFGLLRNEIGGAWLAVGVVAVISVVVGRRAAKSENERLKIGDWDTSRKSPNLPPLRYILLVESLFLLTFALWAWVRAHDPAADHTEQPMDLMFMHSIRASLNYPPQDAWLAGYPISYYYFGFWLFNLVGLLAGQMVGVTYNLAQAAWFGLLLSGAFGVAYNLLAATGKRFAASAAGGLIAALLVGMAANVQGLLEWLYAIGVDVTGLANLLGVRGFPQEAQVTGQWFVDFGWWWWRSSRVLADMSLRGDHIEVIDEFPAFSYILGDNHPHVAAMPFAILAIGAALAIFLTRQASDNRRPESRVTDDAPALTPDVSPFTSLRHAFSWFPLGWGGMVLTAIITGALLFLNTWDYPPYWLLATFSVGAVLARQLCSAPVWLNSSRRRAIGKVAGLTAAFGVGLLTVGVLLYLPYFLTAQSQAGGLIPNLFHPTRFSQYVTMFATALLTLLALLALAWPILRPRPAAVGLFAGVTLGLPVLFLLASAWVATTTEDGRTQLASVALPDGATEHLPFMLERWLSQPFTFLVVGVMTALALALVWTGVQRGAQLPHSVQPLVFTLALAALGLGLTLTPEVVYLRDNFGWRMNTIFKFYYQAWLLFGLAGAFTIVTSLEPRARLAHRAGAAQRAGACAGRSLDALFDRRRVQQDAGLQPHADLRRRGLSGSDSDGGVRRRRVGARQHAAHRRDCRRQRSLLRRRDQPHQHDDGARDTAGLGWARIAVARARVWRNGDRPARGAESDLRRRHARSTKADSGGVGRRLRLCRTAGARPIQPVASNGAGALCAAGIGLRKWRRAHLSGAVTAVSGFWERIAWMNKPGFCEKPGL